jgi:hypothetical protein
MAERQWSIPGAQVFVAQARHEQFPTAAKSPTDLVYALRQTFDGIAVGP